MDQRRDRDGEIGTARISADDFLQLLNKREVNH